jgi:tetratricopeptide (TPR) repeat protein
MRRNEWGTAEGYWKQAIRNLSEGEFASQDQRLERAYYYMGLTQIELKKFEDAVGSLKEAVRMKRDAADLATRCPWPTANWARWTASARNSRPRLRSSVSPGGQLRPRSAPPQDGDKAGAAELFRRSVDNAPAEPSQRGTREVWRRERTPERATAQRSQSRTHSSRLASLLPSIRKRPRQLGLWRPCWRARYQGRGHCCVRADTEADSARS